MCGDLAQADGAALLPGEIPHTDLLEDARHWVSVYEELTSFLAGSDLPCETLERYRRRLAYWRCRERELDRGAGQERG